MAEFVKVVRDKQRMCETVENCARCPIGSENNKRNVTGKDFIEMFPNEAEKKIEDWAKKNPAMTNEMKFKEVFGQIPVNKCYADISHRAKCAGNCDGCRYYAYFEYHAPEGSEKE